MKKRIIVINGSGGKGKDTFIEFVSDELMKQKGETIINFSSVDRVKSMARIGGWDGGKSEKDRKFLSDLKDLLTEYNDRPYKDIEAKVNIFEKDSCPAKILFIHIREPKEIQRVVDNFGAKTLLVKNNNIPDIITNNGDSNVYNYNYDLVIDNNGKLDDLYISAQVFVENIENMFD